MFDVSISAQKNEILGEFIADSYFFEPTKYEYAFYLYKNDERIDTVWYAKSAKVSFDIKNMKGEFYIKVFIKDIQYEGARTYNSKKIKI